MGVGAADILYYIIHFQELKAIIQWTTWHNPVHERVEANDSEALKRCFHFLAKTSRSFSAVIQELHPELLVPCALFYLILRGMDTIEDDMTVPLETKEPMLRSFHTIIEKEGWNFDGNGPKEKDRQLLVEFHNVTAEFRKVKPEYRKIIADIAEKMGNGMADYANNAEHNANGVNTIGDYDLYCHYVAGLVGEGLTRLFVESKLANPALLDRPVLQESMGLFLQKTNIIRDVHEDWKDNRRFWPKEIWSKYVDNFDDLFSPEHADAALNCSSEMVLNAMGHMNDCLFYLAGLKEQSVFNFGAIPQTMAIATLELVFRNPNVFKKHVKITKGQACQIMTDSTQNLRIVCDVFRTYTRRLHHKNTPRDPNFLKISIACGQLEQFIESLFPSQDPRAIVRQSAGLTEAEIAAAKEAKKDTLMIILFVGGTLVFMSLIMVGVAWFLGARFDIAAARLNGGNLARPDPIAAQAIREKYDRVEL